MGLPADPVNPYPNPWRGVRDAEGFEKVGSRKRSARKPSSREDLNKPKIQNKFEILNSINEEGEGSGSLKKKQEEQPVEKENYDPTEQKEMDSNGSGMGD